MDYEGKERRQYFELRPPGKAREGILIDKRRMIVGSSEQCDIVLPFDDIGPIHAILEMTKEGKKLYDMNTASGCYVNGAKTIDGAFNEGDVLKFGEHEFEFKKFSKEEILPPVLDMLDPMLPPRPTPVPKEIPKAPPIVKEEIPTIEGKKEVIPPRKPYVAKVAYPLAEDPKAQYSEYIFEDTENLIPIFTYVEKSSIEVSIMFKDKIFSVDFLPVKNGTIKLVGRNPSSKEVEYPYFEKKEKFDLIKISGGQIHVNPLPGYESLILSDIGGQSKENGPVILGEDDILRFYKGTMQIYIRQSTAPPKVASAPIFPKDGLFSKSLGIVYLVLALFLVWMQFFVVVDKEKEEEKAPKRIAKILYKPKPKPKPVAKTKDAAKKVQTSDKASKAKKTRVKKTKAPKKVAKKAPPKKAAPPKAKVKVKKKIVTRKPKPKKKRPAPPKAPKKAPRKRVAKKARRTKSKGRVETYKSFNFKSNISNLQAKSGSLESVSAAKTAKEVDMGISGSVGGSGATTVKQAKIDSQVGSLEGATSGKLETGSSVSGLSEKKSIYTAGVPGRTVVLGSMDPDIIYRILKDHSPQFKHCYQQQLDDASQGFSGRVKMDFIIGASGSVTKAGVESTDGTLPRSVGKCITNVIRGIKFPRPQGGGMVEVAVPFSFFPSKS